MRTVLRCCSKCSVHPGGGMAVDESGAGGTVAGVLLAAGGGSRLGQPKALVEVGGQTLAERGVATLRDGGASPVLVISGAALVSETEAPTVHHPDWETHMGYSLAVGLHALETLPGADPVPEAAVIALADQTLVGGEPVRRLT